MKQFNLFKGLLLLALFGSVSAANAQTLHPVTYGYVSTDSSNYYKDYVGVRFNVVYPASIAGSKKNIEASNNVADGWTAMTTITTPLVNDTVVMGPVGDTIGSSLADYPLGSMTGKIAVIWRGTTEFGQKAYYAQHAGAIACIIVNNVPGGGPLGMLSDALGATVTIPTFMIGNDDGNAISAAYAQGAGVVTLTITTWGLGFTNDLGFVPAGYSVYHDFAIPYNQISSPGQVPYNNVDGAFIANYGTADAGAVSLNSNVTFTPTGGSASSIHSATQLLETFPAIDSIWAIYIPEYNVASSITGTGVMTTNYSISTATDDYPADDTLSYSTYITDSIYSKGRYDFTNDHPIATAFQSPGVSTDDFYLWGPMYYVAKGGTNLESVTWSMASNTDTNGLIGSSVEQSFNICVYKWIDGSNGQPLDSFIENGELELIGLGYQDYNSSDTNPGDTSGGYFTSAIFDSGSTNQVHLDANSWYFVAPELPSSVSGSTTWFLGCDGVQNNYPRTYGRANFGNYVEYPFGFWGGGSQLGGNLISLSDPATAMIPVIFGGTSQSSIDSVIFSSQKGLVPAVSMRANNHPNTTAVTNVAAPFATFQLYPNPATDYVNVSVALNVAAKKITYTVVDAGAHVISTVVHEQVQNDSYSYATSKLASGNYFMIMNADGKSMFKKFTVIK